MPLEMAATLRTNPASAYQMLHDFVTLRAGDVVIQNGSNSAVGQAVIQIAKKLGVKTVNIVRDRDNIGEMKEHLKELGADWVWTEEEHRFAKDIHSISSRFFSRSLCRKSQAFREKELPKPVLALNCVGGSSATELAKSLAPGGAHVTYGGMSLKPVTVPTSALIFKDISIRGYWLSRNVKNDPGGEKRRDMYAFLGRMAAGGELRPPRHEMFRLAEFKEVLGKTMKGQKEGKVIFDMR